MKVSRHMLKSLLATARTSGRFPRRAERVLDKGKGAWSFDLPAFEAWVEGWREDDMPIGELIPGFDPEAKDVAHFGHRLFFEASLLMAAGVVRGSPTFTGDIDYAGRTTIKTALIVDGNLTLMRGAELVAGGAVIVHGDVRSRGMLVTAGGLQVAGRWIGESAECRTAVCGDAVIDREAHFTGETFVGGQIVTPLLHVDNANGGFLKGLGGARARVAVEDADKPISSIDGALEVDVAWPGALVGQQTIDEAASLARLDELLGGRDRTKRFGLDGPLPKALAKVIAAAREGDQVFRSEVLDLTRLTS